MLDVAMLGQFDVRLDGEPVDLSSRPLQLLLAYLMLNVDRTLPREKIAGVIWPESLESTARKNLRNYVWRLRKTVGDEYLTTDRNTLTFDATTPYRLDVQRLEEGASADNTTALIEAVSTYRGELLPGHYDDWVQRERERLRAVFERHMQSLLNQLTAEERWSDLVTWSEHWIAFGQTPEPAYRSLMVGYAGLGDLAGVVTSYRRCRKALEEELGVAPSQETEALYRQIEAGDVQAIERFQTTTSMAAESGPDLPSMPGEESAPIFVTRERELLELSATLDSARQGKGQVQFVIGGAGRGKTALVAKFARQMQESDSSLLVISGHCHGHAGISDPYAPFREALSQLTGDVSTWSGGDLVTRTAAQRLWAAMPLTVPLLVTQAPDLIDTLIPGTDLVGRATTFAGLDTPWFRQLSARVEAPYRDNLQQKRLFGQVARVLKAVAVERPLLFILEDLHWADDATTGLLFHLSREISHSRILLLGTYRPDEIAAGLDRYPLAHIIGELKRQHGDIWLDLGKVNESAGRAFIDAYLDTKQNRLKESFRQALFEHTGGHALFVVELLRGMQEREDLIQDEDGIWTTRNGIDWQTLPTKVEGVIEQRFGRLDTEMQSALLVASVEGVTFTAEVVAQVRQRSARELVQRFSAEVDRQHRLVKAGPHATVGSQRLSHYHFRHQLFQQYLYQGLDELELVYLHEDVGRALEGLYGEEARQVGAQLAYHFEKAGLTAQAIGYLSVAARRAARLGANSEVIEHCYRGLTLLNSLPESTQTTQQELALQVSLGHALMATRGYANAETGAAFTRARELCGRVGDTPQLVPILRGIWAFYLTRAEYGIARELAEEKLRGTQKRKVAGLDLNYHWMIGMTLFHLGEFALADEHLDHLITSYDPEQHRFLTVPNGVHPRVSALSYDSLCLFLLGYPDRASANIQKALQLARTLSHSLSLAFALVQASWLHTWRPHSPATLEHIEECIALTTEHGFLLYQTIGHVLRFSVLGMQGETSKAIEGIRQAQAAWKATGAQFLMTDFLGRLAAVCGRAGQVEEGLTIVGEALAYRETNGEAYFESELYRLRGELLWQQGANMEVAEADLRRAVSVARKQKARMLELRASISLCRMLQKLGRKDTERQTLAGIYGWFTEGFEEPVLLEAKSLLDELS